MRILLAVVIANVAVSLTDWYFFGVLWHEKYKAYPEVWRRPEGGPGEGRAVALSALVGALTPTAFIILCVLLDMVRLQQAVLLGVGVWLMGPIPMWIWNYLFIEDSQERHSGASLRGAKKGGDELERWARQEVRTAGGFDHASQS